MTCYKCKVYGFGFCGSGCGLCEDKGEVCIADEKKKPKYISGDGGEEQNVYPV